MINAEVLIVGGNYSGLSLAAALGTAGIDVIVLERGPSRRAAFDGRTLALSYRSMKILKSVGVAEAIIRSACPILDIRVADGASRARLDFDHAEVGDNPFGWIVENHLFHHALEKRLKALKSVRVISSAPLKHLEFGTDYAEATLEDGRVFKTALVVGADGRNSFCRAAAGIPVYGWDYRQTALACVIRHDKPHGNIAVEHFLSGGPLATLPMTDDVPQSRLLPRKRAQSSRGPHRSSIIWTLKTAAASALMELDDRAFEQKLESKVGDWLGSVQLAGARFSYPLSLQHAERYTAPRLALIGDAAHGIHPIAGQGFNLGMGDIGALTEELSRGARLGLDAGHAETLRRYEKRRKFDDGNMVVMTDGLTRLFSNSIAPVEHARRFGLGAVQHMPRLKRFFMRTAMGLSGTDAA